MYFFKHKGRQILDLRGDFIITHNSELVVARVKSAAPRGVRNARYIAGVSAMGLLPRLRVTFAAIRFIWGRNQSLLSGGYDDADGR